MTGSQLAVYPAGINARYERHRDAYPDDGTVHAYVYHACLAFLCVRSGLVLFKNLSVAASGTMLLRPRTSVGGLSVVRVRVVIKRRFCGGGGVPEHDCRSGSHHQLFLESDDKYFQ